MTRYVKWLTALLVAGMAGLASAATTYTLTGVPFSAHSGVYSAQMAISGSFTTAVPLAANMPLTQIGPGTGGSNAVTAWSFTDGVNTFDQNSSSPLYGQGVNFMVATDAQGNVSSHSLFLVSPASPHTVGQALNTLLANEMNVQATIGQVCTTLQAGICFGLGGGATSLANAGPGVWTFVTTPISAVAPQSVPATSDLLLVLMALGLGVLAYRQKNSRPF